MEFVLTLSLCSAYLFTAPVLILSVNIFFSWITYSKFFRNLLIGKVQWTDNLPRCESLGI